MGKAVVDQGDAPEVPEPEGDAGKNWPSCGAGSVRRRLVGLGSGWISSSLRSWTGPSALSRTSGGLRAGSWRTLLAAIRVSGSDDALLAGDSMVASWAWELVVLLARLSNRTR